jgi:biopolymer transport protein ExbD
MAGTQNIGEASDNPVAINVTAMVDVIFCLCLFFMCSFQFKQLEGKIESWLPKDRGMNTIATGQPLVREEIRVFMKWNPDSSTTSRSVLGNEAQHLGTDSELMAVIRQRRDEYTSQGKTDWPLMIDAQAEVPWQDVVHLMDLCKNEGLPRIEFAAPEAPIN